MSFYTVWESFSPVWRVCKDRTHTVNDDYHLLKLKIKKGENHFLLFSFPHPQIFFPRSPLLASPQPVGGVHEILKLSTLKDEFLHRLKEFLTSLEGL